MRKFALDVNSPPVANWPMGGGSPGKTSALTNSQLPLKFLRFSPDGRLLASVTGPDDSSDFMHRNEVKNVIHVWNVNSGEETYSFGPFKIPRYLAFSNDSKTLYAYTGVDDMRNNMTAWSMDDGTKSIITTLVGGGPMAFAPDGRMVISGWRSLSLWDKKTGLTPLWADKPNNLSNNSWFNDINVLGDSGTFSTLCTTSVASSTTGQQVQFWDMNTKSIRSTYDTGSNNAHLADDGSLVVSASGNMAHSTITVWDFQQQKATKINVDFAPERTALAPRQKLVATVGNQSTAQGGYGTIFAVYDIAQGKPLWTEKLFAPPMNLSFAGDGALLVSSGWQGQMQGQGMVEIRDARTGKQLKSIPCGKLGMPLYALSQDGKTIATTGDKGLTVQNLMTGNSP